MGERTREELIEALREARTKCKCHTSGFTGSGPSEWIERARKQSDLAVKYPRDRRAHKAIKDALTNEFYNAADREHLGVPEERAYYPNGSRLSEARRKY